MSKQLFPVSTYEKETSIFNFLISMILGASLNKNARDSWK